MDVDISAEFFNYSHGRIFGYDTLDPEMSNFPDVKAQMTRVYD